MRALLLLALGLAACKGKTRQETAARIPDAAPAKPEPSTCEAALAAARDPNDLGGGLALVLEACQPCGVSWDPLIAMSSFDPEKPPDTLPAASEILAVLDACKATCEGAARAEVQNLLAPGEYEGAPSTPWRKIAERCTGALHLDEHTTRFARGTWYALAQIARAHPGATAEFPLPPFTAASTAFALPRADGLVGGARAHVTVTDKLVFVGVLPYVMIAGGAPSLVPGLGVDYPGNETALDDLAKAVQELQSRRPGGIVLIAPRKLPLERLVEVLRTLPSRIALAATPASKHSAPWPEPLGALRIGIAASPGGASVPTLDLSKGPMEPTIAALEVTASNAEVHIVLPRTAQVADLARALVLLEARHVAAVDITLAR